MRPLFVAGCQRTGTTALTEYLNDHPEVLVCQERYKYIPRQVTPDHFLFDRILDYGESETNMPEEWYADLVARKDPARLKWIGDKNPDYYKHLHRLSDQNPGARFIMLYRPLEEVAESFEARARNPEDRWPAHYDLELSVKLWNWSLNSTREFVETTGQDRNVLVIGYHEFFRNNASCIPLVSRFLGLDFDEPILESWSRRSSRFEETRRRKTRLSRELASLLEENKDDHAEEWTLNRIERQREDPEAFFEDADGSGPVSEAPRPQSHKQRIERLQKSLEEELRNVERLKIRNQRLNTRSQQLEQRLNKLRDSES